MSNAATPFESCGGAGNPFESYSEAAKPVWRARQERTAAKRAESRQKTAAEKAGDEDAALMKRYMAIQREKRDALLAGPHGKDVRGLQSFIRTMEPSSAPALLRLVQDARWIAELEPMERLTLSAMIQRGIVLMLTRHELLASPETIPFGGDESETSPCHQAVREHIKSLPYPSREAVQ